MDFFHHFLATLWATAEVVLSLVLTYLGLWLLLEILGWLLF